MRKPSAVWIILLMFLAGSAYPEEKEAAKHKFSLKFTAGLGSRLPIGDVNDALKSFNDNDVFRALREANSDRLSGGLQTLDGRISHWEAELRFDLSPRIGFGIATSAPIHERNESSVTYIIRGWAGDQIMTWTFRPEIRVSNPIKMSVYYTLPLLRRLNILVGGGAGLYPAKISQFRRYDAIYPQGDMGWFVSSQEVKNNLGLGFHGNLTVEYQIHERLALVAEFQASYSRISRFKGTLEASNQFGEHFEKSGTLYYFTEFSDFIGARHITLEVNDIPPEVSTRDMADIRKARLHISGYSLRGGIRVALF